MNNKGTGTTNRVRVNIKSHRYDEILIPKDSAMVGAVGTVGKNMTSCRCDSRSQNRGRSSNLINPIQRNTLTIAQKATSASGMYERMVRGRWPDCPFLIIGRAQGPRVPESTKKRKSPNHQKSKTIPNTIHNTDTIPRNDIGLLRATERSLNDGAECFLPPSLM